MGEEFIGIIWRRLHEECHGNYHIHTYLIANLIGSKYEALNARTWDRHDQPHEYVRDLLAKT